MKKTFFLTLALAANLSLQAQSNKELRKLELAEAAISRFYVDSVAEDKIVESAIRAMLKELDPHSTYSTPEEVAKLTEPLEGSFEGIGVTFNMVEDTLVVIQPVVKGPSEKVGILAGDRIIAVNDSAIAGVNMPQTEITKRLRGPKGSMVKLSVLRQEVKNILHFNVKRDKIPVHSLNAAYLAHSGIGYIQFDQFGRHTHEEMIEAIQRLQAEGMESLIIDLQDNSGGYLDAAIDIVNEFLNTDEPIVYTEGRNSRRREYRANGRGMFKNLPLMILVNQNSASAAEILAGAIQDNDRGTIVGRRTYGKGLVQRAMSLPDESMIRLTIARYYTPSGRCIQRPYEKGHKEDYNMDILHRIESGELYHEDSVRLDKSVVYETLKDHRKVYGGGGIMPDFFVPVDTMQTNLYYRKLAVTSAFVKTTLKYLDKHRVQLKKDYPNFDKYYAYFEVDQELLDNVVAEGKAAGVEYDEKGFQEGLKMIKLQLKGLLARDLWDTSEYFQILNQVNPIVQKGLELLEE